MIFVTVGLERFPFDRLLRTVDRLVAGGAIRGPVFGQIGHSGYEPRHFESRRFLPFGEMKERLEGADRVVCHAGVGTILLALHLGKIPLVFPRRAAFGEQLDDHQLDLTRRLGPAGRVLVADTEEDLSGMLARYDALAAALPVRAAPSTEFGALVGFLHATLGDGHGA